MEDFSNAKSFTTEKGLPPWPQRPAHPSMPFVFMPSSTLPSLAPNSFQVRREPYFFKTGGNNNNNNNNNNTHGLPPPHSDHKPTLLPALAPLPPSADDGLVKSEIIPGLRSGKNVDPNMDPKKLKRIISNRVSAQKSRMKKVQYVTEMERKAKALETEIAMLHPQVAMYRNQQQLLQMEHNRLNQEMSSRTTSKILKDAEIEENKAEVNRLRQLHLALQQKRMQEQMMNMVPAWKHGFEQMMNHSAGEVDFMNSNTAENGDKATEMGEQQLVGQMWMPTVVAAPMLQQKILKTNSNLGGIEHINFSQNPHGSVI